MADILAELFAQFSSEEQARIRAAEALAKTILVHGDRAVRERAMGPLSDRNYTLKPRDEAQARAACAEFAGYQRVLARRVDPLSPESVQEFLRQLNRVREGVLMRYGYYEGKEDLAELLAEAERLAWLSHAQQLARAKAAPAPEQLATEASAQTLQRRKSLIKKFRDAHNLTMPSLARRTGASETAIRGMVRGDRTRYSEEKLVTFLKAINVSRDEW